MFSRTLGYRAGLVDDALQHDLRLLVHAVTQTGYQKSFFTGTGAWLRVVCNGFHDIAGQLGGQGAAACRDTAVASRVLTQRDIAPGSAGVIEIDRLVKRYGCGCVGAAQPTVVSCCTATLGKQKQGAAVYACNTAIRSGIGTHDVDLGIAQGRLS